MTRMIPLVSIMTITLLTSWVGSASAFDPKKIELGDPAGDDKGPGKYTYPTRSEYKPGSFDLLGLTITDRGATLEFKVKVKAKVEDPWNSSSWGGNGFSLQMIQVYINTKRGGFRSALPGINIKFEKGDAWDKVVFISPQPRAKIISEVKAKKRKMLKGIVVPQKTSVRGREIVAVVKKSELGAPKKTWGFQAVMQSNEGYPDKDSILARKVNEYSGQHRFGGGNDYNCDPHAIDILTPPAKGTSAEAGAQYKALGSYTCKSNGKGRKAIVPMVYPGK